MWSGFDPFFRWITVGRSHRMLFQIPLRGSNSSIYLILYINRGQFHVSSNQHYASVSESSIPWFLTLWIIFLWALNWKAISQDDSKRADTGTNNWCKVCGAQDLAFDIKHVSKINFLFSFLLLEDIGRSKRGSWGLWKTSTTDRQLLNRHA
jgi:hypothetical protein